MKKLYSLYALLPMIGICCIALMASCSSDDEGGGTPPPLSDNSFSYGDAVKRIESVVYTVEEKVYTFYFSPTKGLIDLDAMLLADDYIKIETKTPTGDIDLLAEGNSLLYEKINVSAANAENVSTASLSLQLTSVTTAKVSLEAAMKSGETLRIEYNGTCVKSSEQQSGDDGEVDMLLDKRVFGFFMGKNEEAGTNEYYLAMTDGEFTAAGTNVSLSTAGNLLFLDFFGTPGKTWKEMPTGTFTESESGAHLTYKSDYSFVRRFDESGASVGEMMLTGPVTIKDNGDGTMTITATCVDDNDEDVRISYTGEIRIANGTFKANLPQIDRDMVIDGVYAEGVYMGDVNDLGSGMSQISIYDELGANKQPNGSAINIVVFSTKFNDPKKDRKLIPGKYSVTPLNDDYGKQGTWMPAQESTLMGMVFATGTYAMYDNGTQDGIYSYAVSGTVEIAEAPNNEYTITYDLESGYGFSIKGSYTGDVYLEDQSDDNDDDGSSTLEQDLDMDLKYLEKAYCYPQSQIFVPGLGKIDVSELTSQTPPAKEACGYQFIDIGQATGTYKPHEDYYDPGKLVEGDIIRLDLLVKPGDENKITPGTYTVSSSRYPAQMWPGVAVRGYQAGEGHIGTRWLGIGSAIGNGVPKYHKDPNNFVINGWINIPSVKGYASIYEGTVTIEKADGGDNYFTFTIDGEDVLHHKIRGSWTGPVYFGGTNTPVTSSNNRFEAKAKTANTGAPALREHYTAPKAPQPHNNMPSRITR